MTKLKTLTRITAVMFAAFLMAACGDDKEDEVVFSVTPQAVTIQDGSTPTVAIQTNGEWYVSMITESWLTATPMSGSGNGTVTLTATGENSTKTARSAQLTITERKTQQVYVVNVTQQPPTPVLRASESSVELASTGQQVAVSVTANVPWLANSSEQWLSVTPLTGSGNGSLTIVAEPNTGDEDRTATITLTSIDNGELNISISVKQTATLFNVTPLSVTLSEDNDNTETVTVETTAQWSVVGVSEGWLSAIPSSGTGTATLTLKATANGSRMSRTAAVTLQENSTMRQQTVSVTQLPPPAVLTTDKQSLSFAHGAANEYVAVTSNIGWTVRSSASWCTVSPSQGEDDGSITVSVTRNEAFTPRTATITVTPDESGVQPITIQVTQAEYVEIKPGEGDNTTPAYSRTRKQK